MSGWDDGDDFFSDYDPSKYESYNNNSNDDYSYGGGGRGRSQGRGRDNYSSPRRGGGGRGGRGRGRSFQYSRDDSRDSSNVDVAAVEDLIQQRSEAKRDRDYDTADAIRDQLMQDYKVGVDDRERTWRTGVSASGSGRGNFRGGGRDGGGRGSPHRGGGGRRPRQNFGPNGHDYEMSGDVGPNSSGLSEGEIHGMIAERLMAKLSRDFGTADAIQTDLVARGVFVHDGIKEWRWDGVPFGDFSERRGNNPRGNPGRTAGSRNSYEAAYMKSSFSPDVDGLDRDFEKADSIREGLRDRYNVLIDDRLKMWSVGGDFGEEHNSRRELAHQFATRGYVKSKSSLSVSPEDEAYIQEQIDERSVAKRDRDFRTADDIRQHLLEDYEVSVNDKIKMWSIGGAFEETGGGDKPRGVYTRRGGGDLSDEVVQEIQDLLAERYTHKKNRDFDAADAIRDDLEARYDVRIDDRSNEWRIDSDDYFGASTGNLSPEDIEFVTSKLKERFQCKRDRDYDAADAIRDELADSFGVAIDDRTKEWTITEDDFAVDDDEEEADDDDVEDDADDFEDDFEEDTEEDVEETDDAEEESATDDEDADSSLTEEDLSKLTVVALKEKLRDAGLPVSGKKSELIARLLGQ
eukprot:jgi/Psemu1/185507/e_gw1.49.111.1